MIRTQELTLKQTQSRSIILYIINIALAGSFTEAFIVKLNTNAFYQHLNVI